MNTFTNVQLEFLAIATVLVLFFTWALPVFATVALISKVIFTIIAVGFVSFMSYEMIKTELELQAYRNKRAKELSL